MVLKASFDYLSKGFQEIPKLVYYFWHARYRLHVTCFTLVEINRSRVESKSSNSLPERETLEFPLPSILKLAVYTSFNFISTSLFVVTPSTKSCYPWLLATPGYSGGIMDGNCTMNRTVPLMVRSLITNRAWINRNTQFRNIQWNGQWKWIDERRGKYNSVQIAIPYRPLMPVLSVGVGWWWLSNN